MSEDITKKLDALNKEYYKRFWELSENSDAITNPETVIFMREALHKQYVRDYELLVGEQGIETDRKIEKLKIERDEQIEVIKLEHEKVMAEIESKRTEQNNKIQLACAVADKEYELEYLSVIPDDLPKRWWQRWARPNDAKILSQQKVDIMVDKYFTERVDEINRLQGKPQAEVLEILFQSIPKPRGRRARRQWEECIIKIADKLKRREEAAARINKVIIEADDADNADRQTTTFDEVQEEPAAEEIQAKPKRKRKYRAQIAQEENQEQIAGQMDIDELSESAEPKPPTADKSAVEAE